MYENPNVAAVICLTRVSKKDPRKKLSASKIFTWDKINKILILWRGDDRSFRVVLPSLSWTGLLDVGTSFENPAFSDPFKFSVLSGELCTSELRFDEKATEKEETITIIHNGDHCCRHQSKLLLPFIGSRPNHGYCQYIQVTWGLISAGVAILYAENALGIWIFGCRCILESSGSQNSGCT